MINKINFFVSIIFISLCAFSMIEEEDILGRKFEKLLKDFQQDYNEEVTFKQIIDFLEENKKYKNKKFKNGTFLQIAANNNSYLVFYNLLEFGGIEYNLNDQQKENLLNQAINNRDLKAVYFLLLEGRDDPTEFLKIIYKRLLDEKDLKQIIGLSYIINKHIGDNEINFIFLEKILNKYEDLGERLIKIVSIKKLPGEKKFLLPLLMKKFKDKWSDIDYILLFNKLSKFRCEYLVVYIDSIIEIIILDSRNIDKFYSGVISYLQFHKDIKKECSHNFKKIALLLLERLEYLEGLNCKYKLAKLIYFGDLFCSRIEEEKIVKYLYESLLLELKNFAQMELRYKIILFATMIKLNKYINIMTNEKLWNLYHDISIKNNILMRETSVNDKKLSNIYSSALIVFRNFERETDLKVVLIKLISMLKYITDDRQKIRIMFKVTKAFSSNKDDSSKDDSSEELKKSLYTKFKKIAEKFIYQELKNYQQLPSVSLNQIFSIYEFLKIDIKNIINIKEKDLNMIRKTKSNESMMLDINNFNDFYPNIIEMENIFIKNKALKLFCNNSKNHIKLEQFCEVKLYKSGDVIFSKGEDGKEAYVVMNGCVHLKIGKKLVKTINESGIFGDFSLFLKKPTRSAKAIAVCECQLKSEKCTCKIKIITINDEKFHNMAIKNPSLLVPFLHHFRSLIQKGNNDREINDNYEKIKSIKEELEFNRVKIKNLLLSNKNEYPEKSLKLLAKIINSKKTKLVKYGKGLICLRGDICDTIFIVIEGEICAKAGSELLKKYGKFDTLGELNIFFSAYNNKLPERTASLETEEGCTVIEIPLETFEKKIINDYDYFIKLIRNLINIILDNNEHNYVYDKK